MSLMAQFHANFNGHHSLVPVRLEVSKHRPLVARLVVAQAETIEQGIGPNCIALGYFTEEKGYPAKVRGLSRKAKMQFRVHLL